MKSFSLDKAAMYITGTHHRLSATSIASLHASYKKNQQGFSLLEMTLVVAILAITAAIALPNLSMTDPYRLDNAARELAAAIRFARAEAIRTATPHGLWYFASSQKLSIYRVVVIFSIPVPIYDVRHPVDKKLYTLDYSSNGNQAPVKLSSVTLNYGGSGSNQMYISFDKQGTPRYLKGSTYQMLDLASFVLSDAGQTRTVSVSPMTGRVTLQ